ncbi:OrNVorf119-like [Venturia canescens]|uniref:OrNVorf119-like n=2 Tax=Venturia canescens TaxID=32260 RepID=A0ACB9ZHI6_9HYME|nr:uncharacterized LOC122410069 [Venturia canescens]AJZ73128.1 hypothetical protein [Venturia canescens]KAI5630614.1 OrNVorf119-like [Venturia canescens]
MEVDGEPLPQFTFEDSQTQVEIKDIAKHGVVISIPAVYVSCSETVPDRATANLRVIDYQELESLVSHALSIETATTHDDQIMLSKQFVSGITSHQKPDATTQQMVNIIELISAIVRDKVAVLDTEFIDSSTTGISFDVIRRYKNNKTHGLLSSCKASEWHGASFYSQLNPEETLQARQHLNDTDLNRIYYTLQCFEQTMLFEPQRVYDKTIKITNLCLLYMCLIERSKAVLNLCSNDLKNNLLGFTIDMIIRSRVIGAWRKSRCGNTLLNDIGVNYNNSNPLVMICRLETARDRANCIIELLSNNPKTKHIATRLSYDEYQRALSQTTQTINGNEYFVLDSKFITSVVALQGFAALNQVYAFTQDD